MFTNIEVLKEISNLLPLKGKNSIYAVERTINDQRIVLVGVI